jgi:hypothetical protein
MLNVQMTVLTDEELDAVAAAGVVNIVREYGAVGNTSSIDSTVVGASATVLGLQITTLRETTLITSGGPDAA